MSSQAIGILILEIILLICVVAMFANEDKLIKLENKIIEKIIKTIKHIKRRINYVVH